jgi:hypothetical protein
MVPQWSWVFLQVWLLVVQCTRQVPVEQTIVASSQAELSVHVTRHAWSSGQLTVASKHAFMPTQATVQAQPGGQSTVWASQPAQSMLQIPSASSQSVHTSGQLPPGGETSSTQGPPVVVSVEEPPSPVVPLEVAPDEVPVGS